MSLMTGFFNDFIGDTGPLLGSSTAVCHSGPLWVRVSAQSDHCNVRDARYPSTSRNNPTAPIFQTNGDSVRDDNQGVVELTRRGMPQATREWKPKGALERLDLRSGWLG